MLLILLHKICSQPFFYRLAEYKTRKLRALEIRLRCKTIPSCTNDRRIKVWSNRMGSVGLSDTAGQFSDRSVATRRAISSSRWTPWPILLSVTKWSF